MASGIAVSAASAIPSVSACSLTVTAVIVWASTVTSTVTSPLLPLAEALYVPAVNAFSDEAAGDEQAVKHKAIIRVKIFFTPFFIAFSSLSSFIKDPTATVGSSANIHNSEYLFLFLIFSSIWLPGRPHESLIEKRSSDDCGSFVLLQGNQD